MSTPAQQPNERSAWLCGIAAVLLWSTVATAFKLALAELPVVVLLAGASLTSWLFLSLWLVTTRQLKAACVGFTKHFRQALLLGLINPFAYYLILFEAYDRLPAQVAQPVNYTWAIMLALLSVPILKQKLSVNTLIGLVLGYGGVVCISFAGREVTGALDSFGLALALISTVLWALFWLLNTKQTQPPVQALFQNFSVATPLLLLLVWWLPIEFNLTWTGFAGAVYVGLFEMGLTFVLWQTALTQTNNAARLSSLIFLSPFISLLLIQSVLGEPLQALTWVGLVFIIAGVVVAQHKSRSATTKPVSSANNH